MNRPRRIPRWLAPISSGALLILLISRVSSCAHVAPPETAQQVPPASPPAPASPKAAEVQGFEYLGATKAAPMVIGDSLHEPPASEPAVEEAAPPQAVPPQGGR